MSEKKDKDEELQKAKTSKIEWKPDKSQILTFEETLAKSERKEKKKE